jgi:hypothetical protein
MTLSGTRQDIGMRGNQTPLLVLEHSILARRAVRWRMRMESLE